MLLNLCKFKEIDGKEQYPSIIENCLPHKYENQDKILNYLKSIPEVGALPGKCVDLFNGNRFRQGMFADFKNKVAFSAEIPYYVENYNFRFPPEIEKQLLEIIDREESSK